MSSYLKRTKVFFFAVAVFMTCMLIICSYKFSITEKIYKTHETNVKFRIANIKKSATVQKQFSQSPTITTRSFVTNTDDGLVTFPDNSTIDGIKISVNVTESSDVSNTNKTTYAENNKTGSTPTVKSTLVGKGFKNNSSININNSTINDAHGKNGIDNATALSNIPEKLKSINKNNTLSYVTRTQSSKNDMVKAQNPFDGTNENIRSGNTQLHIVENENNEHSLNKGMYSINSLNGLRNNKQRLTNNLQKSDNLKAYLLKLGLPNHIVSQITNEQFGQHSSGLGATFRPEICKNCFRNDFSAILDEPELCNGEVYILILISSSVSKRPSRDAIRHTWGSACNKPETKIKCLFLFGKTANTDENQDLIKESEKYHDIVQHDFRDTYANLTFKTMTAMKWAVERCPKATYVMKTDDDMFVNTELLPILLQAAPSERFMGGVCWGPSPPHRELSSKWYVSFQQYSHSSFPSMCSGTGYVMSGDVVPSILAQSKNIPFFYLEDVYIALCLKKVGIRPLLLQGFHHTLVEYEPCDYRNRVITSHGLNDFELLHIWKKSQQCEMDDVEPSMLYLPRPY